MRLVDVRRAISEMERCLKHAKMVVNAFEADRSETADIFRSRLTADLRRSSMDVTRALSDLRRTPVDRKERGF